MDSRDCWRPALLTTMGAPRSSLDEDGRRKYQIVRDPRYSLVAISANLSHLAGTGALGPCFP
jgi:hypothetical protein